LGSRSNEARTRVEVETKTVAVWPPLLTKLELRDP
jgi:hypothetical protein